jgi:hypothetical protein
MRIKPEAPKEYGPPPFCAKPSRKHPLLALAGASGNPKTPTPRTLTINY